MKTSELLSKLESVKAAGKDRWQARCPAHDDRNPSLSITETSDGKTLLHCHAGCTPEQVCNAIGLRPSDLFPDTKAPAAAKQIVNAHEYQDEHGDPLFEVVRFVPKDFRQRHKENGEWVWNMKGVRRVLYRLPEIMHDIAQGFTVFVCEGEKDVEAMVERGFSATCNVGGAGKWDDSYSETLRGADVVIVQDNDEPGKKHAELVASKLKGVAKRVRILSLPNVKDAYDYFATGATANDFNEVLSKVSDAPEVETGNDKDQWFSLVEDAADILTKELPEIVEIVNGILPEHCKVVIASGSKSFKTWVTIAKSLCISAGAPFWGRATLRKRVLYVNLELRQVSFERRVQAIAKALNVPIDRSTFHHLPLRGKLAGLQPHEIISRIIAVAQRVKAEVVVIDPVYKMNTIGDENSSRDQTLHFNEIDRLTTEAKCAVILNDHFGKGNQSEKDPLDAIRGSSAKGGDVDGAIILRRHEVENCFRVDVIQRELPPIEPFVIGWRFPLMELRPDLSAEKMKKASGGRPRGTPLLKVLEFISDTTKENPISMVKWSEKSKIPRGTLAGYAPEMRSNGWIATVGEGNTARQHITERGIEALAELEAEEQ